jgi:ferrous-iron efflux pump FieF
MRARMSGGNAADRGLSLARVSAAASAIFAVVLGLLASRLSSELALAQASDSLLDVLAALVLSWAVVLGRTPRDAGHPMGHSRAEALGALGIAGLSTLLAFEVGQSAVLALLSGQRPRLRDVLLLAFVGKASLKVVIWYLARGGKTPALRALAVDARNDIGVGLVAVVGFLCARYGLPELDAWLTLPLAAWIGWAGVGLARENVELLMGSAPPPERQASLLELARSTPGVIRASDLRAQFLGHSLSVQVEVGVLPHMSVREGYELAERVRRALEAEADVLSASVLVAPAEPKEGPA